MEMKDLCLSMRASLIILLNFDVTTSGTRNVLETKRHMQNSHEVFKPKNSGGRNRRLQTQALDEKVDITAHKTFNTSCNIWIFLIYGL